MRLYDLLLNAQAGDEEAVVDIILKFNLCIKKFSRNAYYEEVETDLIISLIELINDINLSNFNPNNEGALVIFIHKFLSNTFKNLCKKNKRRNKMVIGIDYNTIIDNSIISFDSEIFISMLVDSLPQLQKQIIYKKYIQGYSDREISIILNTSRQAVNRAKNRGLKNIRKLLLDAN